VAGNLDALASQLQRLIDGATTLGLSRPDFHLSLILCFTSKANTSVEAENKESDLKLHPIVDFESSSLSVKVLNSRPDLGKILEDIVRVTLKGGVGIGVCGPSGLVQSMERLVRDLPKGEKKRVGGVEIYAEAFSL
jgi:ferric-chelate reductase